MLTQYRHALHSLATQPATSKTSHTA